MVTGVSPVLLPRPRSPPPVLRNLAKGSPWSETAWPDLNLGHKIQMLRLPSPWLDTSWCKYVAFTFHVLSVFENFIKDHVWQMTKISFFPRAELLGKNISHSLKIILFGSGSNLSWVTLHPFVSSPPSTSPTGCSDSHGLRNFYDKPNYFSKFLSQPTPPAALYYHPQWPAPATGRRRRLQIQGS